MGNIFDDELDGYVQQDNPTVPEPQPEPQQKSAEQAELEKILAVIKGIKESHSEVRETVSDIENVADRAEKPSKPCIRILRRHALSGKNS